MKKPLIRFNPQWKTLGSLMDEVGFSAIALAKMVNVTRATVYKWLHGERAPSLTKIKGIAASLAMGDARKCRKYLSELMSDVPSRH